jgi:hypothetical protein
MITLVGIVSKWKANPIKIVGKETITMLCQGIMKYSLYFDGHNLQLH